MASPNTKFSLHRIAPILWGIGLVTLALVAFQPAANVMSRTSMVILLIAVWCTALRAVWKWRWLRYTVLLSLALPLLLVARTWPVNTSAEKLRAAYVRELRAFTAIEYFWGGESRSGIDCSGLIRRGMINACWHEGLAHADLGLIQRACSLWWHDTSAEAMAEEYRGLTKLKFKTPNLTSLDHAAVEPGCIAVTQSGHHVMAYLGDARWIEADPGEGKVVELHAPTDSNPWLKVPMKIMQWGFLTP